MLDYWDQLTLFSTTLLSMVRIVSKIRRYFKREIYRSKVHPPKALQYIGTHHPTHTPQELHHLHRLGSQHDIPQFKTKVTQ